MNYTKVKRLDLLSLGCLLFAACCQNRIEPGTTDLTEQWDTLKVLENPDKGWYHHMLDNGISKYLIGDDSTLAAFPGMDHLYLRLCWAYLEPEEGRFDWSYIDDIVEKYVPLGYKISFRISCKETGPAPGSVPYEIDGIRYATPHWVREAGAKGVERPKYGSPCWTPEWNDPVYLEKLDNFHRAFAERYDGQEWVRYVDVGSIGDWGEGHTYSSTRKPVTFDEIKTHIDLYLRHYAKTQLIVTDDLVANAASEGREGELLDYVFSNGISLRDDSPMVDGYMKNDLDSWTVRHPEYFERIYRTRPVVFELEHYGKVKANGYWLGRNGCDTIPQYGVTGAEVFTQAVKLMHPTYIGYHGYMDEWLADNPDFTGQMLNLCGYWYFPESVTVNSYRRGMLDFDIEWLNRGVAPAYEAYRLEGYLKDNRTDEVVARFEVEDSGNRQWMPGTSCKERYSVKAGRLPSGDYGLYVRLYDRRSDRPVDMGLSDSLQAGGCYHMADLSVE